MCVFCQSILCLLACLFSSGCCLVSSPLDVPVEKRSFPGAWHSVRRQSRASERRRSPPCVSSVRQHERYFDPTLSCCGVVSDPFEQARHLVSYQIPKKVTEEYAFRVDYVRKLGLHLTGELSVPRKRGGLARCRDALNNLACFSQLRLSRTTLVLTSDRWMGGWVDGGSPAVRFFTHVLFGIDSTWSFACNRHDIARDTQFWNDMRCGALLI